MSWANSVRWRLRATRNIWFSPATPESQRQFKATAIPGGCIDAPATGSTVSPKPITIEGWAMLPSGPAARVELWLNEKYLGRARLGLERPDICDGTGDFRAAVSGFAHTVDLAEHLGTDGIVSLRATATGTAGERLDLDPLTLRVSSAPNPSTPIRKGREALIALDAGDSGETARHVLICTHQLDFGGAQTFLIQLVQGLLKLGVIKPTVLSTSNGPLREEFERLGVPVHISTAVPFDDLDAHLARVEELTAWAASRGFEMALINTATALTFPGAEVAARLGLPAVWAIHESFPPAILWEELDPGVRALGESALAGAAMAIFEAEATQRLYEDKIDPARCITLPYGLDIDPIKDTRANFNRGEARRALGIAADADVVLCAGAVEPRKAQIPLAQAFDLVADRHPNANLVFVGGRENPDSYLLEEWFSSLPSADRIRLVPMTSDVYSWYGLSDMLVCASDIESLPRSVLEAMAWELPVLATDVFGLPELIDDGKTGWLCAHRDVEALATGLDRALSTGPSERQKIGQRGRRLVERRHAMDAYCEEVAGVLDRAAGDEGFSLAERVVAG